MGMSLDQFLNNLNQATKEEFSSEYEASEIDILYLLNSAIARGMKKTDEIIYKHFITDNSVDLVEGQRQDDLYSQEGVYRKAESKSKGYWITRDSEPNGVVNAYELKLQLGELTFTNTQTFYIDDVGYAKINIECEQYGIKGNLNIGELTKIKTPLTQIGTGINEEALEGGQDFENDYEYWRRYTRFRGSYPALTKSDIEKEILSKNGVKFCQLIENDGSGKNLKEGDSFDDFSKVLTLNNGLVMPNHSFVAYVDGGTDIDVARSIALKVNTSATQLGNISVDVYSNTRKENEVISFYRTTDATIYYKYNLVGEVDIVKLDTVIKDYIMNSDVGITIYSFMLEKFINKNVDLSKLMDFELLLSKDNLNFEKKVQLLHGEVVGKVVKNG